MSDNESKPARLYEFKLGAADVVAIAAALSWFCALPLVDRASIKATLDELHVQAGLQGLDIMDAVAEHGTRCRA